MHFTLDTAQRGQAEVTSSAATGDPATTPGKVPPTGAPHFPHSVGIVSLGFFEWLHLVIWPIAGMYTSTWELIINSLKAGRPVSKADRRYIDEERLCLLCITPEKEFM